MADKMWGVGTSVIGVKPATNLLHGVRFASDQGAPLNLEIVIAWHRLGLDDEQATPLFRRLRRSVTQALAYRERTRGLGIGRLADVVSHENPDGYRNTHWLLRVPNAFRPEFIRLVERFLLKLTKAGRLGRALLARPVTAPGTLAKYLLKGVEPAYGGYFSIEPEPQGRIAFRGRTFVSRALGGAARRQAGWKRKRRPRPH